MGRNSSQVMFDWLIYLGLMVERTMSSGSPPSPPLEHRCIVCCRWIFRLPPSLPRSVRCQSGERDHNTRPRLPAPIGFGDVVRGRGLGRPMPGHRRRPRFSGQLVALSRRGPSEPLPRKRQELGGLRKSVQERDQVHPERYTECSEQIRKQ